MFDADLPRPSAGRLYIYLLGPGVGESQVVVFPDGRVMVIDGQTMPDAVVRLHLGRATKLGHANAAGAFQFKLAVPAGTYEARVKARDAAGQTSTASMSLTKGDAVIAWIDTMIQVIKGAGRIAAPGKVHVDLVEGGAQALDAKHIIIATGSDSVPLPGVADSHGALDAAHRFIDGSNG